MVPCKDACKTGDALAGLVMDCAVTVTTTANRSDQAYVALVMT